ncbi:hypothetical protein EB118_19930 [bacterium]|nr:hypothetical protein [bacterium]NDG32332.1 hypothetical protein [bacterium]
MRNAHRDPTNVSLTYSPLLFFLLLKKFALNPNNTVNKMGMKQDIRAGIFKMGYTTGNQYLEPGKSQKTLIGAVTGFNFAKIPIEM